MSIEFDTAEEGDFSRQFVIGIVAVKRRHTVSLISGRMAHDIPIVDHSLSRLTLMHTEVTPHAQLIFGGSVAAPFVDRSAVGNPDRFRRSFTLT